MSNKSWWWMIAAALSLVPLAACEAPGAGEQEEEVPAGGDVMGTETDPATGTEIEERETDPAIEEGGGSM